MFADNGPGQLYQCRTIHLNHISLLHPWSFCKGVSKHRRISMAPTSNSHHCTTVRYVRDGPRFISFTCFQAKWHTSTTVIRPRHIHSSCGMTVIRIRGPYPVHLAVGALLPTSKEGSGIPVRCVCHCRLSIHHLLSACAERVDGHGPWRSHLPARPPSEGTSLPIAA